MYVCMYVCMYVYIPPSPPTVQVDDLAALALAAGADASAVREIKRRKLTYLAHKRLPDPLGLP